MSEQKVGLFRLEYENAPKKDWLIIGAGLKTVIHKSSLVQPLSEEKIERIAQKTASMFDYMSPPTSPYVFYQEELIAFVRAIEAEMKGA